MKLEKVNLFFKIMVYVPGILPLLVEKASGVGVLPHGYATSFAARFQYRHLPTTLSEMMIGLNPQSLEDRFAQPHATSFLVHIKYLVYYTLTE